METVAGLLLLLIQVSHVSGVDTHCDARQDGAQCNGTVGGAVIIQLMNNFSEIPRFQLKKENSIILVWRNNSVVTNTLENRLLSFPSNGTFRINNLIKKDSGEYKLQLFTSDGTQKENRTFHLSVEGQSNFRVGAFSALVIFLVCIIVISALRKKQKRTEEGDDTELTYADVRVVQQPARTPVKQKVEEVEYGEIKSTL